MLIDLIVSSQARSDSNQPINRALRDPRFVEKAAVLKFLMKIDHSLFLVSIPSVSQRWRIFPGPV